MTPRARLAAMLPTWHDAAALGLPASAERVAPSREARALAAHVAAYDLPPQAAARRVTMALALRRGDTVGMSGEDLARAGRDLRAIG